MHRYLPSFASLAFAFTAIIAQVSSVAAAELQPLAKACSRIVTIDVGHDPAAQGATSAAGTPEYLFNWRLAQDLSARLRDTGWKTTFLVQHGEKISLAARAARISKLSSGFLVSIHHDSVQPQFLVRKAKAGAGGPVSLHARGYSLFVKNDSVKGKESIALARAIGTQMIRIPLKPNPTHAEHIAGENRPWVDSKLGIYAYNGLAVLRASHIPAVLIEAAVIVNPFDEAWISAPANRKAFAGAVAAGLAEACPAVGIGSNPIQ